MTMSANSANATFAASNLMTDAMESHAKANIHETIFDDGIICLIDGKKKRHLDKWLRVQYGMTPREYRKMFKLGSDYPMSVEKVEMPTPTTRDRKSATILTFERPQIIARALRA